jgi:putative nucleotidyltransferase with HDIG domain
MDPEDPEECADFLKSYTEKYQMVAYLGVANYEGDVICGFPGWTGQINIKNREYYKNVIENEKYSNGYFIISRASNLPSIIYAYPFKSLINSDEDYILLAVQDINDIYNLYIKNPSLENIDVVFYDSFGKFIYGSHSENSMDSTYAQNIMNLEPEKREKEDFYTNKENGIEYLIFRKAIRNNGKITSYLSIRIPSSILYGDIQKKLATQLIIFFLVATVSMLSGRFIVKTRIIGPLETMMNFFEAVQKGDLKNRLKIKSGAKDMKLIEKTANGLMDSLVNELDAREQAINRISALNRIDKNITGHKALSETYQLVLEIMRSILNIDACIIMEYQPGYHTLRSVADTGFLYKENNEYFPTVCEELAYPILEKNETIIIQNLAENSLHSQWKYLELEAFNYFYGIPMIVDQKIVGVIGLFQRDANALESEKVSFAETLAGQTAIAIENSQLVTNIQKKNIELKEAYDRTIEGWSKALEIRDDETSGHTDRVTRITVEIAKKMGFNPEKIENIRRGALLHDIGKIGIPDEILLKRGALNAEERKIIEKHPVFAFNQLEPIKFLHDSINIPYCHHEKWDGTGYPRGLKGIEIPIEARIFSIVDVWDALRSDRPYRDAWPEIKVINYLNDESGTFFDPDILDIFLDYIMGNLERNKETK